MYTKCIVELDARLLALNFLDAGSTHSKDITIGVPLDMLDEHARIDKDWRVVSHVAHQLHTATLIGDAKLWGLVILVLVAEALTIGVVPLDGCKRHLLALKAPQAVNSNRELEVANVVVYVNSTLRSTE